MPFGLLAQPLRKQFSIVRTAITPKIDAIPDDKAWEQVNVITDFIQQSPINGGEPTQHTEVKMLYDDKAIYVLAMLYDTHPDSIFSELSDRDNADLSNADLFSVEIDPYNKGLNSFEFRVSAAGVQTESQNNLDNKYTSWDAVWKSEAKKYTWGWVVEMEIPYSALRFPKIEVQEWGINFYRLIKRNGETSTWNFVDANKNGWLNQTGLLKGVRGIKPPVRLSLMPYLTTYFTNNNVTFKGGMDLKYGINQSFTLDMMLIPDFGQTRADDAVLNLTSVETKYDEKRQFFTEGTELFSRGDIFYSRRIGGTPRNFGNVYSELNKNEIVTSNSSKTNLYNATKLSGYTTNGWGIGVLNAVSQKQYATVEDTVTHTFRKIATQGVTNYNMFVVDKNFGKESYISFLNSNVAIPEEHHLANVSGVDFKYTIPSGYLITGDAFVSYIQDKIADSMDRKTGYRFNLNFSKTKGLWRYTFYNVLYSDKYNPTDLGYIENNNMISNHFTLDYLNYKPSKYFNNVTGELGVYYDNYFKPLSYSRLELSANVKFTFKTFNYLKFYVSATPIKKYDFFEPRVEGWKSQEPTAGYIGLEYMSDYRKKLTWFVNTGYWAATQYNKSSFYFSPLLTYRFNDRISASLQSNITLLKNAIGYVQKKALEDSIFYGRRNNIVVENIGSLKVSITNKSSFNFRLRHYWSNVDYQSYYLLNRDGTLENFNLPGEFNTNYNAINNDITYLWQFLPGSSLSVVWKNYYTLTDQNMHNKYFTNFKQTSKHPLLNAISVKIVYYFDYLAFKKNS